MKSRFHPLFLAPSVLILSAGISSAVIVVNDGFEAATHAAGYRSVAVFPGIPVIQPETGSGSASLAVDDSMGNPAGNKALSVTSTSVGSPHLISANLGGTISLANVNDTMTLSFKIRLTSLPSASASGFRFGLYSTNGSSVLTEGGGAGAFSNDTGYYATVGVNGAVPAANNVLWAENSGTDPILAGTDRDSINSAAGPSLNDTLVHTLSLTVTRTSASLMMVSLTLDGGTVISGTTGVLYTSFDEIVFSNGYQDVPTSYNIDDVLLTATNFSQVPEPAVAGLLALASLGMMKRRRGA